MNKRVSNKKHSFDGTDPQKSLMKSLESIKSLLKQGDSKINAARENIARADNSISSDSLKNKLNKKSKNQNTTKTTNTKNTTVKNSTTTKNPDAFEIALDFEIPNTLEKIIVKELPSQNIFKAKSTKANKSDDKSPLNDLYDHDLIVPILEEVVEPEDDESSLFNDSSSEIKLDSILEINDIEDINDIHLSFDDENSNTDTSKSNADIISFELGTNAIKNNQKNNQNISLDDAVLELAKSQKSVSLVEDSQINIKLDIPTNSETVPVEDQVIIKETTLKKSQITEPDLSHAVASVESESQTVKQSTLSKSSDKETDFSKIAGLDTLKINADIMHDLQNRVEKRVHDRLIQLIVQLDEEIKDILTDEIKLSISQEITSK